MTNEKKHAREMTPEEYADAKKQALRDARDAERKTQDAKTIRDAEARYAKKDERK